MKKMIAVAAFVSCCTVTRCGANFLVLRSVDAVDSVPIDIAITTTSPTSMLEKNIQYAYIARQLGLLDSSRGLWRNYCSFLKKYNTQIAGLWGIGMFIFLLKEIASDDDSSGTVAAGQESVEAVRVFLNKKMLLTFCIILSCFFFGLLYGINKGLGNLFADDTDWYRKKLVCFIEQWNVHKQYTPRELHPLFDHLQLVDAASSVSFDNVFVQELYKQIAALSIKRMTAQPA